MTTPTQEKRQLYILTPTEEIIIEMPATWKVTFGPFNPGQPQRNQPTEGASLRIYEAKDKQRACFTNVLSFRDLGMPMYKRERAIDIDGKKYKMSTVDSGSPQEFARQSHNQGDIQVSRGDLSEATVTDLVQASNDVQADGIVEVRIRDDNVGDNPF